ncbi:MAG TPA: EFR1 family ferrodoxin [Bacillota bacterium]|nr:EFR1 family ferrodoxin [Bacillota bacterium]
MSKVFIHYFSGTGNTKRAVDIITGELEKNGYQVTRFLMGKGLPEITESAEYQIFAFPVLAFAPPVLVKKYLRQLPGGFGKKAAVFSTYGGNPVGALQAVERMLRRKKFEVFLTGGACYPENWTQMINPPQDAEAQTIISAGDQTARDFAAVFLAGGRKIYSSGPIGNLITGVVGFLFGLIGRQFLGKTYIADSQCNQCQICVKTCPVQTIRMRGMGDKKPYWGFRCEDCGRCINLCPRKAIQISIPRLILHTLLNILVIWTAFSVAGFLANAVPGGFRVIGWVLGLAGTVVAGLWIQFTVIDWIFFILEQIPGVGRFFTWSFTKKFRRYLAPGFKPAVHPGKGENL